MDGATLTYTCEYCEYSYTETLPLYTVTYMVSGEVKATAEVAEGYTTELIDADVVEGYTFVGWTTEEYTQNTTAPETVYAVDEEYTVTEDVTLYALYYFTEGEIEESWRLVTADSQLAVNKEIVIVASASDYALGTTQNSNNRKAVDITKDGDTVTMNDNVQIITLEEGKIAGTWAFHVAGGTGTNAANGYLYATGTGNHLRTETSLTNNSSWNISVTTAGVATIKANVTSGQNWLRYNNQSTLFSCYTSGQTDVSIYVKTGGATIYYTTSLGVECPHKNVTVDTVEATCTETGVERTVCECGHIVSEVELPALGHNYVDNICNRCGEQDPASIDYSGYYYISFTHSETVYYADNSQLSSNRYYAKTSEEFSNETKYIYRLEKTGTGIYSLYEFDGDCYQEDITVEKVDGVYRFYATTADGDCQFLLNAGSATKYIKFYKASNATQSNYAQDITLTKVELPTIDTASVTLGEQVILNYYVNLTQEEAANATIVFSVNEQTLDVTGEQIGNRVKFSFFLPPQYMADNIDAKLYIDGNEIDSMSYSIKAYAQALLKMENASDDLKRVVSDMLHYGAAAQAYESHNVENLANVDVEGILAATDAAPATTDFNLVNADVDSYPAYFLGAGVHFDNVNKLYVRINTTEGVTLTINGVEVAVEDTTIRTDGITVANFATTYTFVLYHDGVEMQTLTYSVNAYAYAMQNNAGMKDLALALYRYGVSAAAYNA